MFLVPVMSGVPARASDTLARNVQQLLLACRDTCFPTAQKLLFRPNGNIILGLFGLLVGCPIKWNQLWLSRETNQKETKHKEIPKGTYIWRHLLVFKTRTKSRRTSSPCPPSPPGGFGRPCGRGYPNDTAQHPPMARPRESLDPKLKGTFGSKALNPKLYLDLKL